MLVKRTLHTLLSFVIAATSRTAPPRRVGASIWPPLSVTIACSCHTGVDCSSPRGVQGALLTPMCRHPPTCTLPRTTPSSTDTPHTQGPGTATRATPQTCWQTGVTATRSGRISTWWVPALSWRKLISSMAESHKSARTKAITHPAPIINLENKSLINTSARHTFPLSSLRFQWCALNAGMDKTPRLHHKLGKQEFNQH